MAGGFLSELGPFYATKGNNLQRNEYAWNRVANVLFLDSPAFVGWSYSEDAEDRIVGKLYLPAFKQNPRDEPWLPGQTAGPC